MTQGKMDDLPSSLPFPLWQGEPHECPYLTGLTATMVYTVAQRMAPHVYQYLMDHGFRRSGNVYYRPVCENCQACRPIRIKVDEFLPSRSQRRAWRRNSDVMVEIGPPICDEERLTLFNSYQATQHDGKMSGGEEEYQNLFCKYSANSIEMSYRLAGQLVAVGMVDVCSHSLSSVYFYFDPQHSRRSLGVFSALLEIEECRKRNLPYWYLGFHVQGCQKMEYKKNFQPHEILSTDLVWESENEFS